MPSSLFKKLDDALLSTGDMALKRRAEKIIIGLDPHDGDKIIDVGCGDGYYLYLLANLGLKLDLIGTDFDQVGLKRARMNLDKKIPLINADLMKKLPFKNNSFDKAVMSEVVEHLPRDVAGLSEVYRILKPGGILCLSVPCANYPFLWDPINWILEHLFKTHIQAGFWAGIWNQHLRLYTRKDIVRVVQKAGFEVELSESVTFWSLPFNHYLVNLVARGLYDGKLSKKAAKTVSKYEKDPKRSLYLKFAFWLVNLIDKLNNVYKPKEMGVSVVVKARKKYVI